MAADRTDKFSEIKELTSHFDGTISWIKSDKSIPDTHSAHTEAPDITPQSKEPSRHTPRAEDNVIGFFPVRGQFDSGADDNYISRSLILRAGLEHLIEDPASHLPLTVSTVIGEGTLTERLHLNLSLHGSSRSDTLLFWVSEEGTFDLLIGAEWMQKNERNVFGRRAFAAGHESRLVFKPQDKGTLIPSPFIYKPSYVHSRSHRHVQRRHKPPTHSLHTAKRKQADDQLEIYRREALNESRRGSDVMYRPPAPMPPAVPVPLQGKGKGKGKDPVRPPTTPLPDRPPPRKKSKRSILDYLFPWKSGKDGSSSDEGANGHVIPWRAPSR